MTIPVKALSEIEVKSEVSENDKILILDSESEEARLASKEELKWDKGDKWDKWDTWPQWVQWLTWEKWDKWDQWVQWPKWDKWEQWPKWDTWLTGNTWPQWPQWVKGDKWDKWASVSGVMWEQDDMVFSKDDWTYVTLEWAKEDLKWDTWDKGDKWDKWDKWDTWTAATITVGTTTTGEPWTSASVTNSWTSSAAVFNFTIPEWEKGDTWETWASIVSAEFSWNDMVFTKDDSNTVVLEDAKTTLKGDKGDTGNTGATWPEGNGIESVKSSKSWKITTVVMDFTDPNMSDFSFTVSDWEDWEGSWDVLWPNSSTDGNVVLFDWTSGKLIKDWWAFSAANIWALPDSTKYWATFELSINSSTYVVTATLKDQDWNTLGTAQTIDLPLESVVVSGSYDSATKKVILTLQSWSTIEFSVADLVSWLQTEITSSNKLDADLVDDSTSTNKFVTASDITKLWNLSWVNTGDQSATDFDIKDLADSTNKRSTWDWKQDALSSQTAYTSKGTSTKVPTITTNSLGQVTWITETAITFPVTSVNGNTWAITGLQTTTNLKTDLTDNSDSYYPSQKAVKTAVDAKQNALTTQTAYTSKGSATKVPQITTNNLWQVTGITEVDITHPSQVDNTAYDNTWDWVTNKAPSQNAVYDKISAMDTTIGWKQAQHSAITVTLTSSWWSSNAQTVSATWVTASNTVIVSPTPASFEDYWSAQIYCSAQASNSLTFTCWEEPSSDITVNVVILN